MIDFRDVAFDYSEQPVPDTITGKMSKRSIYIRSGMRLLYIGEETLELMNRIMKENECK